MALSTSNWEGSIIDEDHQQAKTMTEETTIATDPRDAIKLKHPEADVSRDEPWHDDVLGRVEIAAKLTNLIRDQRDPFVISIDGQWGTGKTFLLKRWQKDLEGEGFSAIYFNAWEDDFCDDPLLAIIGQLSEYFKKGNLETLADELGKIAIPLLKKNALSILNRATGITFEIDLNERDLLKEYREQRQTKTELKSHLTKISAAVVQETDHPLIFIIDELDRCRPTFAIELLERVKHIFDVPKVVFVFGINRDELCKSLESIYGEIDATVYLRRFFDMEFMLPEVDSETFCKSLMDRFNLEDFFRSLSEKAENRVHANEFHSLSQTFPVLCNHFDLSLRDIDFCVRMIALVGKNLEEGHYMYPGLLSLLIPLKLKNPTLYRQIIQGECHASDVMNYIDEVISFPIDEHQLERSLDTIEANLYLLENNPNYEAKEASAWHQLRLLQAGSELTHPELLSERTKKSDLDRIGYLLRWSGAERNLYAPGNLLAYLSSLIDLHDFVRR